MLIKISTDSIAKLLLSVFLIKANQVNTKSQIIDWSVFEIHYLRFFTFFYRLTDKELVLSRF